MSMADLFETDTTRPIAKVPAWTKKCDFGLLTADTLPDFVDECIASGEYGLDLETTGLDKRVRGGRTVDQIVGLSLSPDGVRARYVPVRHREGKEHNVPWSTVSRQLRRLQEAMEQKRTTCDFFNGGFDGEMLEYCGDEIPFNPMENVSTWRDGLQLAYLFNPARKKIGLKALAKEDLEGIDGLIDLSDLFPPGAPIDFSSLHPGRPDVLAYGCMDAILHFRIARHFEPKARQPVEGHPEYRQDAVIRIEQLCLLATRWMVRNRVGIDRQRARDLIELGQREWVDAVRSFYEEAGAILKRNVAPGAFRLLFDTFKPDVTKTFDEMLAERKSVAAAMSSIGPDPTERVVKGTQEFPAVCEMTSPAQLGDLLTELGVPGLRLTEKETQVDTSKEEIDRIAEEYGDKFPFIKKVRLARQAAAAITNWLQPLYTECDEDDTAAFPFKQYGTETGRFASPQDKHLPKGWPKMNFQNISTPRKDRPECMNRTRECIRARNPEGVEPAKRRYVVSVDMSGVELRIVTNLSREPKWVEAFFTCAECNMQFNRGDGASTPEPPPPRCPQCGSDRIGDLHASTAIEVLGARQSDSDWKDKRGKGKILNFALCYGGGGDAAARAMGTADKNEGWRIKKKFDEKYSGLRAWWDYVRDLARQVGGVFSAFGRWIPTPGIHDKNGYIRSTAERNALNGPVQATSADLTKLAMGLVYKEFKRRGWLERAPLIACMHDELVFEMEAEIMEEAIDVIVDLMARNGIVLRLKWLVPLTCDMEIGSDWSVPWNLTEMRAGEVRFVGNKKYKKREDVEKAGHKWDELPSFPDCLRPFFKRQTLGQEARSNREPAPRESKETPASPQDGEKPAVAACLVLEVPALSEVWAERAASAIVMCMGSGDVPLRVEVNGASLSISDTPLTSSREAVERAARAHGLTVISR